MVVKCVRILNSTKLNVCLSVCLSVCLQTQGSATKSAVCQDSELSNIKCLDACLSVYRNGGSATESAVCQDSELSSIKCLDACLSVYRNGGVLQRARCVRILNSPILNVYLSVCLSVYRTR